MNTLIEYQSLLSLTVAVVMGLFCLWAIHSNRKKFLAEINSLKKLAYEDELTDAANRRATMKALRAEINRTKRTKNPFSVLMIDLDKFKDINDTHGHDAGDKVLIKIVSTVLNIIREIDFLGRIGGDEFLVILPETTVEEAEKAILRIQKEVKKIRISAHNETFEIGLTIGLAQIDKTNIDQPLEDLIRLADVDMYKKKG